MTKTKGTTPGKETLKRSDVEAARAKSLRPEIVKQLLEMAEEGEEFEGSLDSWKMVADCVPESAVMDDLARLAADGNARTRRIVSEPIRMWCAR